MNRDVSPQELLDELRGKTAPSGGDAPSPLPEVDTVAAVLVEGEDIAIQSGVTPVSAEQRVRLSPLSRRANLTINEEYQHMLGVFPEVAAASVPATVLSFLADSTTSLASFSEASGQVALAMEQGRIQIAAPLSKVYDAIIPVTTIGRHGEELPSVDPGQARTVLAKAVEIIEGTATSAQDKAERSRRTRDRLAAQVDGAKERLDNDQKVERLKRDARSGLLPKG